MRKFIHLALIGVFLAASLINEVKAQGQKFEIPLEKEKFAQLKEWPKQKKNEELKPKPKEENNRIQIQKLSIERTQTDKQKMQNYGFKINYYEIYRQAADRYGLEWQILAAIHRIESGQSGDTLRKSGAGATGPMQFIPSTFKAYAVDGDGDGVIKINDAEDAIFTASNYLYRNRAQTDMNHALYRYNHSLSYVNKVKLEASKIK